MNFRRIKKLKFGIILESLSKWRRKTSQRRGLAFGKKIPAEATNSDAAVDLELSNMESISNINKEPTAEDGSALNSIGAATSAGAGAVQRRKKSALDRSTRDPAGNVISARKRSAPSALNRWSPMRLGRLPRQETAVVELEEEPLISITASTSATTDPLTATMIAFSPTEEDIPMADDSKAQTPSRHPSMLKIALKSSISFKKSLKVVKSSSNSF